MFRIGDTFVRGEDITIIYIADRTRNADKPTFTVRFQSQISGIYNVEVQDRKLQAQLLNRRDDWKVVHLKYREHWKGKMPEAKVEQGPRQRPMRQVNAIYYLNPSVRLLEARVNKTKPPKKKKKNREPPQPKECSVSLLMTTTLENLKMPVKGNKSVFTLNIGTKNLINHLDEVVKLFYQ